MLGPFRPFRNPAKVFARFAHDRTANVAVVFSIAAPLVGLAVGAAVDYSRVTAASSNLHSIADGAALAGAQGLRLANATTNSVSQMVSGYVGAHTPQIASPVTVATSFPNGMTVIAVQLDQDVATVVGKLTGASKMHVSASAKARIVGGGLPYCMLALDTTASATTSVSQATLNAPKCQIFSDSSASDLLSVSNSATIAAGQICSHGGVKSDGTSSIAPVALTDCPLAADPLASRVQPAVGSCTFNGFKVTHGSQSLTPGVYCGGLEIGGSANVTLLAGLYVI